MRDPALLLIIANHLKDIYTNLSGHILESGSHRPSWKIADVPFKNEDGSMGKEAVVEKLAPLRTLYETLERIADQNQGQHTQTIKTTAPFIFD